MKEHVDDLCCNLKMQLAEAKLDLSLTERDAEGELIEGNTRSPLCDQEGIECQVAWNTSTQTTGRTFFWTDRHKSKKAEVHKQVNRKYHQDVEGVCETVHEEWHSENVLNWSQLPQELVDVSFGP